MEVKAGLIPLETNPVRSKASNGTKFLTGLKNNKILLAILVVLILVRLAYLFLLHPPLIWIDASQYDELGWNLVQNHVYAQAGGLPCSDREPGYPLFFLAPLYFIFGHSILAVQLFQILLSALIAVLIYYLAKKYFSKTIALLAVLFFALYPPLIAYSSEVLTEIPFTFLLLLTVLLTIKAKEKQSLWLFALAGILCGLATLTRFIALFLPFALFFFFAVVIHSWKKSLKYALIMAVACFAVIAPWILRNYLIFHTFVFRATGGEILWSGSYIPWDGEWKGAISPVKELREGLTPVEIDKKFTRLAFQNIKENPVGVFWIWLKKPAKIFLKSEFNAVLERDNKFAKFLYRFSWLGPALVKMFFLLLNVVILALAALGIKRAWQQNYFITLLFLAVFAYFLLCYLPLNPDSRYKLPLTPYLFIFAASGCLTTGEWFRQQLKSKSQAQVLIKS